MNEKTHPGAALRAPFSQSKFLGFSSIAFAAIAALTAAQTPSPGGRGEVCIKATYSGSPPANCPPPALGTCYWTNPVCTDPCNPLTWSAGHCEGPGTSCRERATSKRMSAPL
jgi:hypothetical protein